MDNRNGTLDSLVSQAEQLAVVGSPSSTSELALDILGSAVTRKLVGELALFRFLQDSAEHYAIGQITEVQLRNTWHEDPTMRSLIRQRGRVDAVSGRQDTHLGRMIVSAVFRSEGLSQDERPSYQPSILGTVPATGTPTHKIDDDVLNEILSLYRDQLFYLGNVYGSEPKLPLWFKHFDRGVDGAGEAYHLGIFGKTGSGKSVLAKMILLAYARHPKMALLVIDPQGEFAKDMSSDKPSGEFALPLRQILKHQKKPTFTLTVRNLVLDRWELFQEILAESRFFRELQILTRDKVLTACDQLTSAMRKKRITLSSLHTQETFDLVWGLLSTPALRNKIYAREGEAAERFAEAITEANADSMFNEVWLPFANLFKEDRNEGRRKVDDALKWLLRMDKSVRPVLVIDVSREEAGGLLWNDTIQTIVIKRLLQGIIEASEGLYQRDSSGLNAMIMIDEAHRFAPREFSRDDEAARTVRQTLVDAARTTRKYGLGWMFISQTLSSLHREIVGQLRILFFGFGLSMGAEYQALRELVGGQGKALELYQLFRDPHSSFDTSSREYSFMTIGPVSPLSFSGSPLFFNAFNTVDTFVDANDLRPQPNAHSSGLVRQAALVDAGT